MKPYLSKTLFLRGLQCYKALWLLKNRPELATEPDPALLRVFEIGEEVGRLACGLFSGGDEVKYVHDRNVMLRKTQELIKSGMTTIYEATFRHDNVLIMVDILHKGKDGWEIYEVKSATELKDINYSDLAIQYYVLSGGGLPIARASLVHINNEYVRNGEIDVQGLFTIENLTDEVRAAQGSIKRELADMRRALGGGCPEIDIGPHCYDPYECDFISHCWAHIPENSVFDLRGRGVDKFAYYKNGIIGFSDLGLEDLNEKQRMQVEAELYNKDVIDKKGIKEFLDTFYYPLYFLDFETFRHAIPPFDGLRPYEHIPFQYSLHCLEDEDAEPRHYEFLAKEGVDQREELIKGLVSTIPDDACVIVYNATFELGVLNNLGEHFPRYREKLMNIRDNIVDLMLPFQRRHYYTKEMKGSYSLKYVLPALLPELSHKDLAISDGQEASIIFSTLHSIENKEEVERIKKDLLEYCKLDTFAMVMMLKELKKISNRR